MTLIQFTSVSCRGKPSVALLASALAIAQRYRQTNIKVLARMRARGDYRCGMKPFSRQAAVMWLGTRHRGKGVMTTPSGVLRTSPYLFDTHRQPGRGTNPPELIAAAHAGSFSMALANELGEAGYSPHQIDTTATVTIEDIPAGWTLTHIHLDVIATVPDAAQCDFIDAALRAKSNCPISRLLCANISMHAKLKRRATAARVLPQTRAKPGLSIKRLKPRKCQSGTTTRPERAS